jgi:hypothetical protein
MGRLTNQRHAMEREDARISAKTLILQTSHVDGPPYGYLPVADFAPVATCAPFAGCAAK